MANMSKIVNSFKVKKYSVLILETNGIPNKSFRKLKIGNDIFKPVPIFDAKDCVAIESDTDKETFIGKNIEFLD
jgi:hypothetical protein